MNIPLPKLKAMMLFFAENTNQKFLGKTKLMKLFYFADFMHVKKYGVPITFDNYVNLEHGPIPSAIKNLVDTADENIDESELADTITIKTSDNLYIKRVTSNRKLKEKDKNLFSKNELQTLRKVCKRFGDVNTKTIEEASHKEAPWTKTDFLDNIPYTLAIYDPDCLVDKKDIELSLSIFK